MHLSVLIPRVEGGVGHPMGLDTLHNPNPKEVHSQNCQIGQKLGRKLYKPTYKIKQVKYTQRIMRLIFFSNI